MIGAGSNSNRGNSSLPPELSPLLQFLPLEPISLGNQKHTKSVELRRVLGISAASASEDHSFGTSNSSEGLKHFKEIVQVASRRARDRAKRFRESLFKLERCEETLGTKKRQRCDLPLNERSNAVKSGTHMQSSPHDITSAKIEDRDRVINTNKRARSVITDLRQVDSRPIVTPKQQVIGDRINDLHQECSSGPFRFEEKIRRLPGGGEGWESKNKKKRSVGAVSCRSFNGDVEGKRPLHTKLNSEAKPRVCDIQGLRSKPGSGIGFINRIDKSLEPSTSETTATMVRNESENGSLSMGRPAVSDQKNGKKAGNKPNLLKDAVASNTSLPVKSKLSRATRTSSIMLLDSSLKVTLSSTSLHDSENVSSSNQSQTVGMVDDRKRHNSSGSMPHPVAQWVGQRPHKNSRMRRSNIVAPVSSIDETRNSFHNISVSEMNPGALRIGSGDSPVENSVFSNILKPKLEFEHSGSPFVLSENEESGAGGTKVAQKGIDNEVALPVTRKLGPRPLPVRKNKTSTSDITDASRKGRSGKASLIRPYTPQLNVDNISGPLQKSSSDKNKSKTGRPPTKKISDRKSTRVFPLLNNGSGEFIDDPNDDREEVIAAITAARSAKSHACSSPFWKKMESVFTSVSNQDVSFLKRQLGFAEELENCLSRSLSVDKNILTNDGNQESVMTPFSGPIETGRPDKSVSLYQRVLSAIIEEDDAEEMYNHCDGNNMPLQYGSDDSHCGSCNFMDTDVKETDKMDFEVESKVNSHSLKVSAMDRISSNKSVSSNSLKDSSMSSSLSSNGYWLGENEVLLSDVWLSGEICSIDVSQPDGSGIGFNDKHYHLLSIDDKLVLELQSIGIFPEPLPDLLDGEVITQDINELRGGLSLQVGRKKTNLEKLTKTLHSETDLDKRKMEQAAMDQLIEMAYRKRLACRESNSSKTSLRKISKQVALAFIKRTLARCQRFEDTGYCFKDPGLQDLLHLNASSNSDGKSRDCVGSGTASNLCQEVVDTKSGGAMFSSSERYSGSYEKCKRREVLIDEVIGSAFSRVTSASDHGTEARGKRSDRGKEQRKVNNIRSVSAVCSPSVSEPKSESKPKLKTKQRGSNPPTAEPCLPAPTNATTNLSSAATISVAPVNGIKESDESIEMQMTDFDSFGLETDDHQDLDFFSNIDDDGPDTMGLEIPMDDLSDLHLVF